MWMSRIFWILAARLEEKTTENSQPKRQKREQILIKSPFQVWIKQGSSVSDVNMLIIHKRHLILKCEQSMVLFF